MTPQAPDKLPSPHQSEHGDGMAAIPKVGALVRLNTGGPDMAIQEIIANWPGEFDRSYLCRYLDGTQPVERYFFHESLTFSSIGEAQVSQDAPEREEACADREAHQETSAPDQTGQPVTNADPANLRVATLGGADVSASLDTS